MNKLFEITIHGEGRELVLETTNPKDLTLYYSVCDQFDISKAKADRLKTILAQTSQDIEKLLKE